MVPINGFKIRTKNSVYEIEPINNRYRKVGKGWAEGWKPCYGGELEMPVLHKRYTIPYETNISTSCVREIMQ